MNRRRLPIGIQSFRRLREADCYYVDKTPLIRDLVERGDFYFLSRPRRFGKSLLLGTFAELFAGNESLFHGLDIHGLWDWSQTHPVVRISFDANYNETGDLDAGIHNQLSIIERNAGLDPAPLSDNGPERFLDLLDRLCRKSGKRVVVLVDEYDKPILDALGKPELARANRDYLRGFYGIVKGGAEYVRFVFVTGVSMFSKVSLFSGMNNLKDISLNPRYAAVCGYTDYDLDTVFAPELHGLNRAEIRSWYNGYHWRGAEKLYNPYDILLLFDEREFKAHWYATGTPDFLFQIMMEQRVSPLELEKRVADMDLLSTFEVGDINADALLFQTGHLTIVDEEKRDDRILYKLDYPNKEVRLSLNNSLLQHVTGRGLETKEMGRELCKLLIQNDFEGFAGHLRSFFAGIPYQWHGGPELARYEVWYAGMLYACFRTIGVDLRVEDSSHRGRADMVLLHGGQVFLFEFKMAEAGEGADAAVSRAINQVRRRGYAEKYRGRGEPIHLVAAVFDRGERNLAAVHAERF